MRHPLNPSGGGGPEPGDLGTFSTLTAALAASATSGLETARATSGEAVVFFDGAVIAVSYPTATALSTLLARLALVPDGATVTAGAWARLTRERRERRLALDLTALDSLSRVSTSQPHGSSMPTLSGAGLTWPSSQEHVAIDDLAGIRDEHVEVEGVWQLPSDDPPTVSAMAMTGAMEVTSEQIAMEGVEVVGGSPPEWRIAQRTSGSGAGTLFALSDDVSADAIGERRESISYVHRQASYTAGSSLYFGGAFVSGATAWRGIVAENINGLNDASGLTPIVGGRGGVILEKLRICWRTAS